VAAGRRTGRTKRSADNFVTRRRTRRFVSARERRDLLENVRMQVRTEIERVLPSIVKSRIMRLCD
jgi:hypothetical protein